MPPPPILILSQTHLLLHPDRRRMGIQRPAQPIAWTPPLTPPLRPILHPEEVAYHHLWSGIPEVDLPSLLPDGTLCLWLVDGDDQLLSLRVTPTNTIFLEHAG